MEQHSNASSGSLKTKILLRGNASQRVQMPFYGMKPELPHTSKLLGSDDLLARFDLSGAYQRFCGPRKPKDDLASFLTNICGTSNLGIKEDSTSSLLRLVEKPPIIGKEISALSGSALNGFKLAPGPIPDNCRFFDVLPSDAALLMQRPVTVEHTQITAEEENVDSAKHRRRLKRTLDDFECPEPEKKIKKHRSGEEKEKKQKKKKKAKKKKKNDDEPGITGKRTREVPFY